MEQGTAIHKTLEEEVHKTVPVEVTTKEDGWALRIWNVIQGLRTLRTTGMTRELEVWGLVDGEVVTGIIDQLSYECPDPDLAASAEARYADVRTSRSLLPEYQTSITEYFLSAAGGGRKLSDLNVAVPNDNSGDWHSSLERIYITDVKSRGPNSRSAPSVKSTGFRPTHLQLQLYYHLLSRLITTDDLTIDTLASRYRLDTHRPFSDSFIAEVGSLNQDIFDDVGSSQESDAENVYSPSGFESKNKRTKTSSQSRDSLSVLLQHNSLSSLWSLMKAQLRLTFLPSESSAHSVTATPRAKPTGRNNNKIVQKGHKPPETLLSPILTASYISSRNIPEQPIQHLGTRSFLFDPVSLYSFLSDGMRWWRGARSAKGVQVTDAWKCRICEFRDECSWRLAREQEAAASRRFRRESLMMTMNSRAPVSSGDDNDRSGGPRSLDSEKGNVEMFTCKDSSVV